MIPMRKSIIRKLFIYLLAFGGVISGVTFYFFMADTQMIPFYILPISLGIFLFLFLLFYILSFARPLRAIVAQMQAVISDEHFLKIYTKRVDEIGVIAHFFNKVTEGLGAANEGIEDHDRMLDELNVASQLQADILPKQNVNLPGLQIVAKNRPATELGGDIFDYVTSNNKTYIYIGDATGHGVAAGLIMSMVNAFVRVFSDIHDNAKDVLVSVNKHLKQRLKKTMFMTVVMLCYNHKSGKMTYVGAGHEYILVYRAATGVCEAIQSGGVALGMLPDNSKNVVEKEISLEDGDFIALYTDGITEARNKTGEQYGLDRVKKSMIEYAKEYSAEGVNYRIARDVSQFMEGTVQADDMTLIVMKRDKDIIQGGKLEDPSTSWK